MSRAPNLSVEASPNCLRSSWWVGGGLTNLWTRQSRALPPFWGKNPPAWGDPPNLMAMGVVEFRLIKGPWLGKQLSGEGGSFWGGWGKTQVFGSFNWKTKAVLPERKKSGLFSFNLHGKSPINPSNPILFVNILLNIYCLPLTLFYTSTLYN